ncbi:hypothetical protein B0O80DRAFT_127110 [Mortierella sp. GBAus27b]|nr:hypothetical protein BGX31_001918 [Mortierella sp. GBA43]KAI8350801.1 hypothetical protein B0O80DRAFT_127110 [Mortierella sp. GBAus27b]
MSIPLSQAFRAQESFKVITIPTRQDARSGQRVIRWKDILQYFKDAEGVMDGEDAVLFLTDGNLEDLIPLRIAHHPGVILRVITRDGTRDGSDTAANTDSTLATDYGSPQRDGTELDSLQVTENSSIVRSRDLPLQKSTQELPPTVNIGQFTHEWLHQLFQDMDPMMAVKEQLKELKQQTLQTQMAVNDVQQQVYQLTRQSDKDFKTLHNLTNKSYTLGIKLLVAFLPIAFISAFVPFRSQQPFIIPRQDISVLQQKIDVVQQKIDVVQQKVDVVQQKGGVVQQKVDGNSMIQEIVGTLKQDIDVVLDKVEYLVKVAGGGWIIYRCPAYDRY